MFSFVGSAYLVAVLLVETMVVAWKVAGFTPALRTNSEQVAAEVVDEKTGLLA